MHSLQIFGDAVVHFFSSVVQLLLSSYFFLLICELKPQSDSMSFIKKIVLLLMVAFCNLSLMGQVSEEGILIEIAKYRNSTNLPQLASALNKLAFYYWEVEKFAKALDAFEQSVTINKEIGNNNAIKAIYSNMGMINSDIGQLETALVFFRKSLLISKLQENKQDISTNLINIGTSLLALNRNEEALQNLNEALSVSLEFKNKKLLKTCYELLAETYRKLGDSQKSMEYFALYTTFQKEIQKQEMEEAQKKNIEMVTKAEQKTQQAIHEKKQTEQKLIITQDSLKKSEEINQLKELELQKKQAELKNQQLLTLIFIVGMGFVVIVAMLILRSNQQKKRHNKVLENRNAEIGKQNKEIKAQNLKINHSINYARNIQGALLPEINSIKEVFCDSFIFFSPRDVVSGDFYWFYTVPGKEHLRIVAAIDCTGHGVPGAFMSMLGMSFLEEIVIDKGILEPKDILESLHTLIKTSLNQETTGNSDGMDAAVCIYNTETKKLAFAGAVNPLIIIQSGKLTTINGNYFGIGGTMKGIPPNECMFEQQTISIESPAVCYIFSDGFSDQFGGEQGKKYLLKNFVSFLHSIHQLPFVKQKELLAETLRKWHGDLYPRVDDVLVIGFRL